MIVAMMETDGSSSKIPRKQTPYSAKETIKIYTDWANHYLEKAKSRRFVQDLQVDVSDGVLLADVIEAVTNEKVREINRKPSSFSQAIDNINSSLMFLANLGVNVDGIAARDIRDGNLKAILGLFFSLSRHKQQQKQAAVAAAASAAAVSAAAAQSAKKNSGGSMIVANGGGGVPNAPTHARNATPTKTALVADSSSSRLPSPFRQSTRLATTASSSVPTSSSNIPFPSSASGGLRKPTATGAPPGGGTPHLPGGAVSGRTPSASSSRSTSPSTAAGHSFLPQPTVKSPLVKQQHHQPSPSSSSAITTCPTSSLRSSCGRGAPASNVTLRSNNTNNSNNNNNNHSNSSSNNNENNAGKNSMLDKFKFFNSKDRNERAGGVSKRTSSSSGFSSARSERSDSSNSLCSEPKSASTGVVKCSSSQTTTTSSSTTTRESSPTNVASSPKAAAKGLAKKPIERNSKGTQAAVSSTRSGSSCPVGNTGSKRIPAASLASPGFALAPLEPDQVVRESRISSILSKTGSCNSSNACRTSHSITTSVAGEVSNTDMFPSSTVTAVGGSGGGGGSPAGTGIPKPTAAVKGTSKVAKDDRAVAAQQHQAALQLRLQKDAVKPVGVVSPPSRSSSRSSLRSDSVDRTVSGGGAGTRYHHDGASVALVSPMPNCHEETSLGNSHASPGGDSSLADDQMRLDRGKPPKPSHVVRTPTSSSSSCSTPVSKTATSTRSKVETTFDGGDKVITRETGAGTVVSATRTGCLSRETTFSEEPEDFSVNVKPMAPITTRSAPYGYSRGLSAYSTSGRALLSSLHLSPRVGTVHGESSSTSSSVRSSGSTLARLGCHLLPSGDPLRVYAGSLKRGLDTEYHSDIDCMDFASGYMSDGDVLRGGIGLGHGHGHAVVSGTGPSSLTGVVGLNTGRMADDIASGYLSEGGASLYARRINSQCRLRDGLAAVKECMQKSSGYLHDDSFDDSSSVSSGISDTIAEISTDENLTGSSVGSDQANNANNANLAYGSLKRIQQEGGPICLSASSHRLGGLCAATLNANDRACRLATVAEGHHSHHHAPKVSSGSSGNKVLSSSPSSPNVRKTDSSQQTDNSVFRSSSSGLKRSGGDKEGSERSDLLRRGKSDLEPGKKRGSSSTNQSTSGGGILRKSGSSGEKKSPSSTALSPKSKRKGLPASAPDSSAGGGGGSGANKCGSRSVSEAIAKKSSSSSAMGSRAAACPPTISNCPLGGKRPTSTCSVSSNGSSSGSRSVSSRLTGSSKRSSSERLSESHLVEEALRLAHVSGISRPTVRSEQSSSSPSSCSSQCNGSRKPKVKVSSNSQTAAQELYGLAGGDPEYSRGSLGRRHRQHPNSGSPCSARASVSSNLFAPHGGRSSCGSPRLSLSTRSHDGSDSSPAPYSPSYSWLRPSTSLAAAAAAARQGTLAEAESVESLSAVSSGNHDHHLQARAAAAAAAAGLTQARLMMHHREISPSPRLTRSSSIRSTKSEKLYPSMLQRSDDLDAYLNSPMSASVHNSPSAHNRVISRPTSPTPGPQNTSRLAFALSSSPSHVPASSRASSAVSPYVGGLLSKIAKDDELHGSSLSLVSTTSSLYSTPEEKHNHEVRKLRRELMEAQEKVHTLTTQLTTNAHVVAAFEQSLSNMTSRLQSLTASAERKDSELNDLRATIEDLRKQSVEAGLTTANYQSVQERRMSRQLSTDSVSSVNSLSSACSAASQQSADVNMLNGKKKKKKGWLRSSFSKAFSRGKRNKHGSVSDVEDIRQFQSDTSTPNSPLLNGPHPLNGGVVGIKSSRSSSAIYSKDNESEAPEVVQELEKQLREKDMVLTDIRLEALSSAHQLEFLKDTVTKMRSEMINLKQDNDRLQRIVSTKSLTSSQSSLAVTDSNERRLSYSEMSAQSSFDALRLENGADKDGKLVPVSVFLGVSGDHPVPQEGQTVAETMIGSVLVSGRTKWDALDGMIRRTFKEYVLRVDPASNLGLNAESVFSYQLGEVTMTSESELPELLPYGYLVGDSLQIRVALKGGRLSNVDALAFDTLIPKSIIQRYVSLLTEHRRIILCGPSGTGKTYLAHKLADFLVVRSGKSPTPGTVAMFNVDHKSAKELRQYLANVAEQCETNVSELPSVIILDNLHHVGSLGEVFNGFLSAKYQKCPFIIGTMNQATCSTTNLQLHHNFRWVLCANHMEPVKGFLGRYLRRKLIECEVQCAGRNCELLRVMDWIPKVWQHLNKFLEAHSSSDVTIGPRLFLACPLDLAGSQVWFTDLWNYSLVPYILEAVREGLQLYGRRAPWDDPCEWVIKNYPWPATIGQTALDWTSLLRLRPEDVGYEGHPGPGATIQKTASVVVNEMEGDPLLNMLMRLQEAASYSSPHSNDSDSTSMESGHSNSLHSDDALASAGLESTL